MNNQGCVLTLGCHAGAAPVEDDDEPFEDKTLCLVKQLREQQAEGSRLYRTIEASLEVLGFGSGGS